MSDDHRQKAIDAMGPAMFGDFYPNLIDSEIAMLDRTVDALIAAGFIRETDNTGNDADLAYDAFVESVNEQVGAQFPRDVFNAGFGAARSSGVADTVKEEGEQ